MPVFLTVSPSSMAAWVPIALGEAARRTYIACLPVNYFQHGSLLCCQPSKSFSSKALVLFLLSKEQRNHLL